MACNYFTRKSSYCNPTQRRTEIQDSVLDETATRAPSKKMMSLFVAAAQGFAPGLMPSSKACTVPALERAAVRRVQMGVRRKAPTGVSQTNGRMADIMGQSSAGGGGGLFPGDGMDDGGDSMQTNLADYQRKAKPAAKKPEAAKPEAAKPQASTETKAAPGAESAEATATDQVKKA